MLLLCVCAAVCEGFDLQTAGVAAAGISAEFHPTAQLKGYFFGASTFGLFIGALLGGKLSDHIGRKTVLVTSIALFGLFSLLTSLSWGIASLIVVRFLTGLGLGGALPNVIALISESSGEHSHNANVGIVYAGMPAGGALAALISLISPPAHWRWIFVVGGVLPLVLVPLMGLLLRESPAFERQRMAAAIAPSSVGAPKAGSFIGLFTEGRALRSLLLWLTFFLALLTLYLLLNWLPTLLSPPLTKAQAAGVQIGFNTGGALAALLAGRLLEGRLRRVAVGVAFFGVPVLLAVLARMQIELVPIAVVVTLLGCVVVATQTVMYALAPACYPTFIRGVGVGATVAIGRVGSIVGPTVAGMLVGSGSTSAQLLNDLLPLAVIAALGAVIVERITPRHTSPAL
jgi:AAHS family 3-hydroxyphenylpropionic acid transporter